MCSSARRAERLERARAMDPNESKEEEFSDNESIDSDERELDEVAELIEEEEHQPSEPEYDSGDESSENENLPPLNEIVQFVEKEEECERLVQRKLTVNDKTKWTTESGFGPSGRWGRAAARRPKAEGSEVSIEKAAQSASSRTLCCIMQRNPRVDPQSSPKSPKRRTFEPLEELNQFLSRLALIWPIIRRRVAQIRRLQAQPGTLRILSK